MGVGSRSGWGRGAALAVVGLFVADLIGLVAVPAAPGLAAIRLAVRSAGARTLSAGTARVEMTISTSTAGSGLHASITQVAIGASDFRNHLADLAFSAGPAAGGEVRLVQGMAYEKLPALVMANRHLSTPWVSIPAISASSTDTPGMVPNGDPSATLAQLENLPFREVTGAQQVGSEDVRGVPTSEYRLSLNVGAMNAYGTIFQATNGINTPTPTIRTASMEVWVDSSGLLRRQRITSTGHVSVGTETTAVTSTVSIDYYDFGTAVSVVAPPPDQVTPLANLGALLSPSG